MSYQNPDSGHCCMQNQQENVPLFVQRMWIVFVNSLFMLRCIMYTKFNCLKIDNY